MELSYSMEACSILVESCRNLFNSQSLFVTISPNPKTLHNVSSKKRKSYRLPYGKLTQRLQYEYCIRYIKRTYLQFLSRDTKLLGTCEINKSGNIHMHFLISDPAMVNDYQLQILRRDILNCEDTIKNMVKNRKMTDYMNNIVFLNKPLDEIIEYMDKDYAIKFPLMVDEVDYYKNYYV